MLTIIACEHATISMNSHGSNFDEQWAIIHRGHHRYYGGGDGLAPGSETGLPLHVGYVLLAYGFTDFSVC